MGPVAGGLTEGSEGTPNSMDSDQVLRIFLYRCLFFVEHLLHFQAHPPSWWKGLIDVRLDFILVNW